MSAVEIVGIVTVGVGLLLIIGGAVWAIVEKLLERRDKRREVEVNPQSLEGTFKGLGEFFKALAPLPLGIQLAGVGLILVILGGLFLGVGALA